MTLYYLRDLMVIIETTPNSQSYIIYEKLLNFL